MTLYQVIRWYRSCFRCLTFGIMSVGTAGFFLQLTLLFKRQPEIFVISCAGMICCALGLLVRSWALLVKIGSADLGGLMGTPRQPMRSGGSWGLMVRP